MRITREMKIELLVINYKRLINNPSPLIKYDNGFKDFCIKIENQIIIDSVGVSGLKEVKKRAWK